MNRSNWMAVLSANHDLHRVEPRTSILPVSSQSFSRIQRRTSLSPLPVLTCLEFLYQT